MKEISKEVRMLVDVRDDPLKVRAYDGKRCCGSARFCLLGSCGLSAGVGGLGREISDDLQGW